MQIVIDQGSPLNVPGVQVNLKRGETRDWLAESRERSADRLLPESLSDDQTPRTKTRRKASGKKKR